MASSHSSLVMSGAATRDRARARRRWSKGSSLAGAGGGEEEEGVAVRLGPRPLLPVVTTGLRFESRAASWRMIVSSTAAAAASCSRSRCSAAR